jgi:hypothetical protein
MTLKKVLFMAMETKKQIPKNDEEEGEVDIEIQLICSLTELKK